MGSGANAGRRDGGQVRGFGDYGVERELRGVGAVALQSGAGLARGRLVVEDDLAGGAL